MDANFSKAIIRNFDEVIEFLNPFMARNMPTGHSKGIKIIAIIIQICLARFLPDVDSFNLSLSYCGEDVTAEKSIFIMLLSHSSNSSFSKQKTMFP